MLYHLVYSDTGIWNYVVEMNICIFNKLQSWRRLQRRYYSIFRGYKEIVNIPWDVNSILWLSDKSNFTLECYYIYFISCVSKFVQFRYIYNVIEWSRRNPRSLRPSQFLSRVLSSPIPCHVPTKPGRLTDGCEPCVDTVAVSRLGTRRNINYCSYLSDKFETHCLFFK